MSVFNKDDRRKENDAFCTSPGRDDQIATSAKLHDITYESYGSNGDLIAIYN